MARVALGAFLVLHGLVHLLYTGQARRLFELRPGMTWPHGSWALSGVIGNEAARAVAAVCFAVVAVGYATGGTALLLGQQWWRPVALLAAALSAVAIVLLWDGVMHMLPDQGLIGLLIDLAIIVAVLAFRWPQPAL